jgi:hypothetical protein
MKERREAEEAEEAKEIEHAMDKRGWRGVRGVLIRTAVLPSTAGRGTGYTLASSERGMASVHTGAKDASGHVTPLHRVMSEDQPEGVSGVGQTW